jgi:hypothetical protein
MEYDRLAVFDNDETPDTWLWCLHCERCYQLKDMRQVGEYQLCHYEDCDGDTVMDGWNYDEFRETAHPEWPEIPQMDVVYPQYG